MQNALDWGSESAGSFLAFACISMVRLFLYNLSVHLLSRMGHGPRYAPCIVKLLKRLALKLRALF